MRSVRCMKSLPIIAVPDLLVTMTDSGIGETASSVNTKSAEFPSETTWLSGSQRKACRAITPLKCFKRVHMVPTTWHVNSSPTFRRTLLKRSHEPFQVPTSLLMIGSPKCAIPHKSLCLRTDKPNFPFQLTMRSCDEKREAPAYA